MSPSTNTSAMEPVSDLPSAPFPHAAINTSVSTPRSTQLLPAWIPEKMVPGAIFLLQDFHRTPHDQNPYWAVLACPQCGVLNLIKRTQFRGVDSIICWAATCAIEFRLFDGEIRYRIPVAR